ncbi:beta-lactamase domain-containing protein [Gottschalkia acidurici 9a]|uniref:Beta-lactamase domain-containing protein n=1 Tax=Gottschalkia acidurici (strain ATCC 7906 / DSM 604 / BCRC 14475 / CIP 104303 / KCTC 5404 / NCIMB 10678 / 9a) TaxID=1128398 RepID=K0B2K8_GOTA9|nr:MBL fold metallo-hydrolase [Gottschalkia acidurici]AFS79175.1 beta-lactamase domain-containing protein [Gottschalkia acidurici 9a]
MITELLHKISNISMRSQKITDDIILIRLKIVNACIIDTPKGWFLIDTGMENAAGFIIEVAEKHFGKGTVPKAIILTHGHFDHIGSIIQLTNYWNVPVYAHKLELPYLIGEKDYPQGNPDAGGGIVSLMSSSFPHSAIDISHHIHPLPDDGSIPDMNDWRWIHTPGHSPGHISLFRDRDRTLIVGDAFSTVQQESLSSVLSQDKKISGPPAYLTIDWKSAQESVSKLKDLSPSLAITSHGMPIEGNELNKFLDQLVSNFEQIAILK